MYQEQHIIIRILTHIFDFILLNILWLLTSIPIVTLGTATAALYSVMMSVVEKKEGYIIKDYWKAFCRNFKQSTVVWILLLFLGACLWFDLTLIGVVPGLFRQIGTVVLGAVLIFYFMECIFVFPLIAKFENSTGNMIKNALLIPVSRLPYALMILFMTGAAIIVTFLNQRTIMIGAVIWSAIGVSVLSYANSLLLVKMLAPFMLEDLSFRKLQ